MPRKIISLQVFTENVTEASKMSDWRKYSAALDEDPAVNELLQNHYREVLKQYEGGQRGWEEYDSEEEKELLDGLNTEEKEQYKELQENFVRQLFTYGAVMPIGEEIRRHMFSWLPGCPKNYVKRASVAAKKHQPSRAIGPVAAVPTLTEETEENRDEVLVIKVIPSQDPLCREAFKVKEEVEPAAEAEAQETGQQEPTASTSAEPTSTTGADAEDDDDDDDEEDTVETSFSREDLKKQLQVLHETTKKQSVVYKELAKIVDTVDEKEAAALPKFLPENLPTRLSPYVRQALLNEEDDFLRKALAVGTVMIERVHKSRYPEYKALQQQEVARRYGVTPRKLTELLGGVHYAGGRETKRKAEEGEEEVSERVTRSKVSKTTKGQNVKKSKSK